MIPHGIPEIPLVDPNINKDRFGLEGKTVLLTFGLLSPNKGIEYVIEALPAIIEKHPDVVYIVLGSTHPNIVARDGESYRLGLERLAERLGVASHVIFRDCFVTLEELKQFIGAADIYVTPYLNESQITSGTLGLCVWRRQSSHLHAILACPGIAGKQSWYPGAICKFRANWRGGESISLQFVSHGRHSEESVETWSRDDLAGRRQPAHGKLPTCAGRL